MTLAFDQAQWNTSKYSYDYMKDEVSLICPSSKDLGIQTWPRYCKDFVQLKWDV